MKPSLLLVVIMIFGLVIVALATLNDGVLTLAIPLIVYLFGAVLDCPEAISLTVNRELFPDHAPEGTPLTVKLSVVNQGRPIGEVAIQDIVPAGMRQLDGKSSLVAVLDAQGEMALEYTAAAARGEYNAYEVLVQARDVFGLFESQSAYRTAPRLIVQPRYPKLDRIKIRPPQTRGFAGPIAARQGGNGIGFFGIREYQAGDPQRQINWRLSTRVDRELYTNVFEQERVADVGLILDARERANVTTADGSLFEHALRAAAALAENFLDDGNRVSLLVYGFDMRRVFPGYGKIQRNRILTALAKAQTGTNFALESLDRLPTRFFPAKSQIVMVSALLPEDIAVIARMRAHGYAVMVISPDSVTFEASSIQDFTSPAFRFAAAERLMMLRQVHRSGVPVVNWNVNQPLEVVVRDTLARQPVYNYINVPGL